MKEKQIQDRINQLIALLRPAFEQEGPKAAADFERSARFFALRVQKRIEFSRERIAILQHESRNGFVPLYDEQYRRVISPRKP